MNIKSLLSNKRVLSLDIGAYEIKGVEGRYTNKELKIYNYFAVSTPRGAYTNGQILDKELIFYCLNEELKDKKIKAEYVYLSINSPFIIIREIIIPKVESDEIEPLLNYQLIDFMPMDLENYVVQFKLIGSIYEDEIEKLNILTIAIPKDMIKSHYNLIKDLGLKPLVLDYQPNAIAKLINYADTINSRYPIRKITFAAIDIGYDNTKVSIIDDGVLQVSRVIGIGGKYIDQSILNFYKYTYEELQEIKEQIEDISHIDERKEEISRVASIVKDSFGTLNEKIEIIFRYYITREVGNRIHTILLYGGGANIAGLSNLFSNYFGIPSIKLESIDGVTFQGDIARYINPIGTILRTEV